jgi:hypothetical protein
MARIRIAGTSGASENTIVFSPAGGHSHNGRNSSLIDSTAYSMYDFSPTFVGTEVNPDRAVRQENNRIAFEDVIKRVVNNSVLAPAGIRLEPGSLNGSLIIANTITANQLAANTITASEISAGTITANELSSNIVLINNRITSQNWNGTIQANGTIYSNGIGSSGWAITNTHAVFDSTLIRGAIAADSLLTPGLSISNTGAISSTSFNVTAAGNVTATNANITGSITSGSGTIGGWTIDTARIYGGSTYLYSNGQITSGNFNVTSGGVLSATGASITGTLTSSAGTIGGWTINPASISAGSTALYSNGQITNGNFSVSSAGVLSATGASITGTLTSSAGTIGGWTINPSSISAGSTALYSNGQITNGAFSVSSGGVLSATGVNISGAITASSGTFTGTVNANAGTFSGSITASGTISGGTISGATVSGGTVTSGTFDGLGDGLRLTGGYIQGSGTGVRIMNYDGYGGATQFFNNTTFTSTSWAALFAAGTGSSQFRADGNGIRVVTTGNKPVTLDRDYVATAHFIQFNTDGGGQVGVIRYNSASTVSYVTSSDRRLKENIEEIKNSLDTIKKLKPSTYTFIDDDDGVQYGFIAQEVYEVHKAPVSVGGDDVKTDPWGIDYGKFTPILTAGIKDLIAKIEELEARIQTLEGV